MNSIARKQEIKRILAMRIPEELFEEAYEMAVRKQRLLYQQERREQILSIWNLARLVEGYCHSLTLQYQTADLCGIYDMKKSADSTNQALPKSNHIIASSAF